MSDISASAILNHCETSCLSGINVRGVCLNLKDIPTEDNNRESESHIDLFGCINVNSKLGPNQNESPK